MIFNMIHTAVETNYQLDKFFELPSDIKALLMTYSSIKSKMKAAASQAQKKELAKKNG